MVRRKRDEPQTPDWMFAPAGDRPHVYFPDGSEMKRNVKYQAIVRAFFDRSSASYSDKLLYDAMDAIHSGRSVVGELGEGQIDVITGWMMAPGGLEDYLEEAIDRMLDEPEEIYGSQLQPFQLNLSQVHPVFPAGKRLRQVFTGYRVVTKDTVLTDWDERVLRGHWIVTEDDCFEIMADRSMRRVAPLQYWRRVDPTLPLNTDECAVTLLTMGQMLGVRLGQTPAQTGFRFLRHFFNRAWRRLSRDISCIAMECLASYVIDGPHVKGTTYSYVYDMNSAYDNWLRIWPDLSQGQWEYVTTYAGPYGVYTYADSTSGQPIGSIGGQALEEGRGHDPWEQWRELIMSGWAWRPKDNGDSPFLRFSDACHAYAGPAQKIVRRFPVFVVGKSRSTFWDGDQMWGASTFYPVIWANVVGALQVQMSLMMRRFPPIMAYIDSLHLAKPLPPEYRGKEVGQWKLLDSGRTRYDGLGIWQSLHLPARHQGRML